MSWGAMEKAIKILLVEDNPADVCFIREMLNIQNPGDLSVPLCDFVHCDSISCSLGLLANEKIDVILLDLFLSDAYGFDTFIKMRNSFPNIPIIILTGLDDETLAQRAIREGAQDYLVKEYIDSHLLRRSICHAIERQQLKLALSIEKEQMTATLRSVGDGVVAVDIKGGVVLINAAAEILTGWNQAEAAGKSYSEVLNIVDEITGEPLLNLIEQTLEIKINNCVGIQALIKDKTGKEFPITGNVTPILNGNGKKYGAVIAFHDVTEQRLLEKKVIKTSKLEAIRLLAGGIAHDFNNILMGIVGNISLVKIKEEKDSPSYIILNEAERAAMCGASLTKKLLALFKDALPMNKRLVPIAEILIEMASFALRGSNVQQLCQLDDDLWPVEVDEVQINQVIHNLIMNATQAMPDGGVITIQANNITAPDRNDLHSISLSPGAYIRITVKDQGCGISPEHLDKIFDPYFSTKAEGHGFGLSSSYFIMKQHGGDICVESILGKETTFYLYLPAAPQVPGNNICIKGDEDMMPQGGSGKILVMDDEEMVRNVVGMMLKQLGYEAEFANEGNSAITHYKEALGADHGFDAVILDLTVPGGMGGKETSKKLLELDPQATIIISSGYANDLTSSKEDFTFISGYLAKPYRLGDMDKVLRKVLGRTNLSKIEKNNQTQEASESSLIFQTIRKIQYS